LAWVVLGTLFNVLAKPAGEDGMPWAWNKIECVSPEEGEESEEPEESEEQIPWCQRPAPSGSSTWILTDPPAGAYEAQKGDASPALASFLNCMYLYIHGLRINSISSNRLCDDPTCDTSTSNCGHTANSCHYGGQYCKGLSRAVDFHATAETCSEIREAALQCDSTAWVNWEHNHVHISVHRTGCGCNERQIPNPCPGD